MESFLPSARAVALWLVENTALTFQQIADFCRLHVLEVESLSKKIIKDIVPLNPLVYGYLEEKEIERCTANSAAVLKRPVTLYDTVTLKSAPPVRRYTLRIKRQDRPDAIAWMVKNHPYVSDYQICKLLRTTSTTVRAIRQKTHRLSKELKAKDPVFLGLCDQKSLNAVVQQAQEKAQNVDGSSNDDK